MKGRGWKATGKWQVGKRCDAAARRGQTKSWGHCFDKPNQIKSWINLKRSAKKPFEFKNGKKKGSKNGGEGEHCDKSSSRIKWSIVLDFAKKFDIANFFGSKIRSSWENVHKSALIDWLMDLLIDWSIDLLIYGFICWLIDWFMDWLIDRWIYWLIDWFMDWLIDRWIYLLIDLWMDWLIDWFIRWHTKSRSHWKTAKCGSWCINESRFLGIIIRIWTWCPFNVP